MISPFHFMVVYLTLPVLAHVFLLFRIFLVFTFKKVFCHTMLGLLFIFNSLSLVPFSYPITAYFWSNICLSLLLCGLMFYIKSRKFSNWFLSTLTPAGCPIFLWILLVNLERIRILIQPFTISLRLACNMMAGHVILFLSAMSNYLIGFLGVFLFFEIIICCIQRHVFSMLLAEYLS